MGLLLEATALSFSWDRNGKGWLDHLSLGVEGGHIYGLVGRNGAGKTTLIRLMSGGLRPLTGSVQYKHAQTALEVIDRHPLSLANVVYVPENSDLPNMTVKNFGIVAGELYPAFSLDYFQELLTAFDVRSHMFLPKLSFGQRRKAHIAFALATNAAVVFLDEPSNGLDIAAQILLRKLLIAHLTPERSLIVSTHHVREFETVIDRILVLEHGNIVANASIQSLQEDPTFQGLEQWYAETVGIDTKALNLRSQNNATV